LNNDLFKNFTDFLNSHQDNKDNSSKELKDMISALMKKGSNGEKKNTTPFDIDMLSEVLKDSFGQNEEYSVDTSTFIDLVNGNEQAKDEIRKKLKE
jgi:hypothetical protein